MTKPCSRQICRLTAKVELRLSNKLHDLVQIDNRAAERDEGKLNVTTTFVEHSEAAKLVQPGMVRSTSQRWGSSGARRDIDDGHSFCGQAA